MGTTRSRLSTIDILPAALTSTAQGAEQLYRALLEQGAAPNLPSDMPERDSHGFKVVELAAFWEA